MTATLVMVHGAWHGAWCFDKVRAHTDALGVASVAVDLPGHGADTGELTDLHGDADRVREILDGLDSPVVLVGHSYGGSVITEAGIHPSVRHLVFLCAVVPDRDETTFGVVQGRDLGLDVSRGERPQLGKVVIEVRPGVTEFVAEFAAELFYNGCEPADADRAAARLSPQFSGAMVQQPNAVAWRERPSTYLLCRNDNAVHPDVQQVLADRCSEQVAWDCGHSPFMSHAGEVADLLAAVARRF